jgi:hypothetical protein
LYKSQIKRQINVNRTDRKAFVQNISKKDPKMMHPKLLMDLIASPKVKTTKGKGVGARSLIRNTSRVEGHAGILRCD